ncbi:hypothetical protein MRX96_035243 [Rhipicephalus microplus]
MREPAVHRNSGRASQEYSRRVRELDVFNAACRWLNYKVDERMDQAARLMYCVRFPLMSLMELSHCVEAKTPPGIQDVNNVRIMILSAVCFWVARTAGKEAEVGHLARTPRHYITEVPGVPGSKELPSSDEAGEVELPSLISVTLGAAKARLLPTSNLISRACTREPCVEHLQESRHLHSPDHETEQVRSLSVLSLTAESDSSVDSLAPTVCESTFNDTSSLDAQASRPTTQESNGDTVVHDSQSFFSQTDSCYRSEEKDKLYFEYVDTDRLTMHSDGDRVRTNELESMKARLSAWRSNSRPA